MPLLKFRCKDCKKVFDELVTLALAGAQRCPDCGGETERAYEGACPPRSISNSAGCGMECGMGGGCCPGCCHQ